MPRLLSGRTGAYVLSDLRIGDGPVYVRYGGFRPMRTIVAGRSAPAIRHPDGHLVPDPRTAAFTPPEWVTIPAVLAPHVAAPAASDDKMPYQVTGALHFSNGGGVYRATRIDDGTEVILKEGRPYAGLDARGRDAVTRLGHEHRVLNDLAGIAGVPAVHECFTAWEHTFLGPVRSPIEGRHTMGSILALQELVAEDQDTAEAAEPQIGSGLSLLLCEEL